MSNTTYIEEVLKEFDENWIDDVERCFSDWDNNGHDWELQPYEEVLSAHEWHRDNLEGVKHWLKSKLTQAIRDTEVKAAEKFKETVLNLDSCEKNVDDVIALANEIINTNQED